MSIQSRLLRPLNSFLLQAVLVICTAILLAAPGGAQRVNDGPPEPGSAANVGVSEATSGSPVSVTIVHHGLTEENLQPIETGIQLALLACGIWSIVSGIRQEKGASISVASIVLGALILIDAATLQNQLSWWMASSGDRYQPLDLAYPEQSVDFFSLSAPFYNRNKPDQIAQPFS